MSRKRLATRIVVVTALAASVALALVLPAYAAAGATSQGGGRGGQGVGQGRAGRGQGGGNGGGQGSQGGGNGQGGQSGQSGNGQGGGNGGGVGQGASQATADARDASFKSVVNLVSGNIARLEALSAKVGGLGQDVSAVTALLDSAKAKLAQALADEGIAYQASTAAWALPKGPGRRAALKAAQPLWKTAHSELKAARDTVKSAIQALRPLARAARVSGDGSGTVQPAPGSDGSGTVGPVPGGDTSSTTPPAGDPGTGTVDVPQAASSVQAALPAGPVGAVVTFARNVMSFFAGLFQR
jgi:hypothetical protein